MDCGFSFAEKNGISNEASYACTATDGTGHASSCTAGIPQGGVVGFMDISTDNEQCLTEAVEQQHVSLPGGLIALSEEKLVDTNGAGDAYEGGFSVRSRAAKKCGVRLRSRSASARVQQSGCTFRQRQESRSGRLRAQGKHGRGQAIWWLDQGTSMQDLAVQRDILESKRDVESRGPRVRCIGEQQECLEMLLGLMAKSGERPLGSMGNDKPQ